MQSNVDTMNSRLMALLILLLAAFVAGDREECSNCDMSAEVQRLAISLSETFQDLVETELSSGEAPAATWQSPPSRDVLADIADKLGGKLAAATRRLHDIRAALPSKPSPTFTDPCPYKPMHKTIIFDNAVTFENLSAPTETDSTDNLKDFKVKRQYYLSHIDYATDSECTAMAHTNLRNLYHRVVHPDPKLVIFVLDNNVEATTLQHAISILKETVRALQSSDMFSLKITNTTDFVKFEDTCSIDGITDVGYATTNNKLLLREYVSMIDIAKSNLMPANISHELKILLRREDLPNNRLIILLTDTKFLTDETWLKIFPSQVDREDTTRFAIGVIHENHMNKNGTLGILHVDKLHNHSRNHSLLKIHVRDTGVVGQVASAFISLLPQNYISNKLTLLSPVWEATERDFIVSLIIPIRGGVVGVDLFWSDLAEDIIYFDTTDNLKRAFVLDFTGRVIMHTHFPRPEKSTEKIKFPLLESVENYEYIVDLKEEMLMKESGSMMRFDNATNEELVYSWEWVERLYVVCVVSNGRDDLNSTEPAPLAAPERDFLFHRLDLFPPKSGGKLCRHFKQIATTEAGTVYLSPSAFRSPFAYLRDAAEGREALTFMQNCLAYLRSAARSLLDNPGLRAPVRRHVDELAALLPAFRRAARSGAAAPRRVVRRYAAAGTGVLVMYPGTVLEHDYEPARRPWHRAATARPGTVALSPPQLDVGGAGYVVTLSLAIRGAVLALDLPAAWPARLLTATLPACSAPHVRCFLMNARGYLVAHRALPAAGAGPAEGLHVTHRESTAAIDMLSRPHLVTKRTCADAADGTVQRYYEFNTSLVGVLSNAGAGEQCARYWVAAVPGTDALVGLVNVTCGAGAFCPCSMVDRLCLNCNRMEQNECECPCECAADAGRCSVGTAPPVARDSLCPPPLESNVHKSHYFHNLAEKLEPCFELECESLLGAECAGAVGCAWCELERDGRTPLSSPRCAEQAACWGGVLGALTPYGSAAAGDEERSDARSALGPAAGALVTAGLVLAVALYCYRAGGTTGARAAAAAWSEGETAPPVEEPAPEGAARERLLPAGEEAPVSPYKVVTGCRRPRHAGSDHGYSTMTPHEDSEAAGFSATEPAPQSDDTRSDVSCAMPPPRAPPRAPPHTALPLAPSPHTALPHALLAPVTVHRHMEAS